MWIEVARGVSITYMVALAWFDLQILGSVHDGESSSQHARIYFLCQYWYAGWTLELRLFIARTTEQSNVLTINHIPGAPADSIARSNTFLSEPSFQHARFTVKMTPYPRSALKCSGILLSVISQSSCKMSAMWARPIASSKGGPASSSKTHSTVPILAWSSNRDSCLHWILILARSPLRAAARPRLNLKWESRNME